MFCWERLLPGCLKDGKAVVSKTLRMDVYDSGGFPAGQCDLYSYVNCDALAMCSTAIIFYSWVKAYKEGWSWTTCAVSAVGMGICFLSYYNAYGFILMTFFYFVGTMLTDQSKPVKERWKEMIQKGLFILVIVCVIALWWFIRNAILYGGDSGTPGIERKRGTVCKIPVQAVAQQDLPEKRRLHVAYDLL